MREVRAIIARHFEEEDDWTITEFMLINNKHKYALWTANGLFAFDGYDNFGRSVLPPRLNLIDKIILYPKYKKLANRLFLKQLTGAKDETL